MRWRQMATQVAVCACLASSRPLLAQKTFEPGDNLKVYLLTIGPGASIYERFGHNAIWIRDTIGHRDLVYNYGTFTFSPSVSGMIGFAARFAMGEPRYFLSVMDIGETVLEYQGAQRSVVAQELNLTPAARLDLASRLAINAEPANRYYPYDYYRDNCSTRVRDMLNTVLGGALRRATVDHPGSGSYRFHTLRSITNDEPLNLAIDAAMGPRADQPIDQWQEMFLPEKVQARVRELTVRNDAGVEVPLVGEEFRLLDPGRYHVADGPPNWYGVLALIGVVIAGVITLAPRPGWIGRFGRTVATCWLLLMGIGGLLLLFFWWVSDNVFTYANHNLFILTPIAFAVIPSIWARGHAGQSRWRWTAVHLLVISTGLGFAIAVVPVVAMQDRSIVVLAGLPTLAAAWVALRRLQQQGAATGVSVA